MPRFSKNQVNRSVLLASGAGIPPASMIGSVLAGYAANRFGYGIFFTVTGFIALISVPAIFAIAGRGGPETDDSLEWRRERLAVGDR
ncbi:hypothetical protein [Chelativorans sp. AA-79]|uniref:hypothetical protein n=1 Tax=Chelativorans sp. AA-79 TaxID=3028735 RepID=UPI0023FA1E11|nr:hypothetical protein [Chelativorans sp. AA-79]WEX08293.1 hypothetical protein PVE73_19760 [Chelativorans sp. AA-79]